jgi:aryl-alcohol dehydrogenase-like predicted oxidoreductase
MEQRSFGGGVRVSVLGVGCGRVGSINNTVSMREIQATLEAALAAGINLFDTADIYAQGDSERTLARLMRRHRDRMFVVTKVGGRHSRYAGAIRLAKPLLRAVVRSRPQLSGTVVRARMATLSYNYLPADLRAAVEGSRRRLQLDRLDGLLLHSPSVETLGDPAIHDFLAELIATGRAAHVGASVKTLAEVEAALTIGPLSMLQVPLWVAGEMPQAKFIEQIRARRIAVFVREILERVREGSETPQEAVTAAIAPDFVTATILGVSTRAHLAGMVAAVA